MAQIQTMHSADSIGMMFTSKAVRALGSLHAAFIMNVLVKRYFECRRAGELEPDGYFTCPGRILQERTGLTMPTVNKYIRTLAEKGAIEVVSGTFGKSRRFKIEGGILKAVAAPLPDQAA